MSGVEIAMIAAAAASTALQAKASHDQTKKQQSLLDQMSAYKMQKAQESEAATNSFLQTEAPSQRVPETNAIRDQLASNLTQSVGAQQAFETPQNFAGKVSPEYASRQAANEATTTDRLKRSIDQLAAIGAPAQRDLTRSYRLGEAAGGVAGANSAAGTVGNAFMTDVGNVQADPYLLLASQIAGGISKGIGVRSLRGTGALGSGVPTSAGDFSTGILA